MPVPRYIMVVDDNPANLKLLENMLLEQGYEAHSFLLSSMALTSTISAVENKSWPGRIAESGVMKMPSQPASRKDFNSSANGASFAACRIKMFSTRFYQSVGL